jgi:hypothetical protein
LSKNLENNLILNINVSPALSVILLLVHAGAILLLIALPIGWPLKLGLGLLLGWSLFHTLGTHALRRRKAAIAAIEMDAQHELSVRFAGSEIWHHGRLDTHFVHPWLMLLVLHLDGHRRALSVVVAADAVDPETFRRWRVCLRQRAAVG